MNLLIVRNMNKVLDSLAFRLVLLPIGLFFIGFYGMLISAAIVNLPASILGVLITVIGFAGGFLCFVYFFTKRRTLLWLIAIPVAYSIVGIIAQIVERL